MSEHPHTEDRAGLRDHLEVLRRRIVLVVVVTLLVGGVALGSALVETPIYASSAFVTLEASTLSGGPLEDDFLTEQELSTQVQIVTSRRVAERAAEFLGLGISAGALSGKASAGMVNDTRVMRVSGVDVDPQRAADIANAFADAYLADRREQALERVLEASASLTARADSVRDRIDAIEAELRGASGEDAEQLARERDRLEEQQGQLAAQESVLEATDAFVRGGGEVLRRAEPAGQPLSPQPVRDAVLGLAAGLLLGAALAFVREWFDDTVRSDSHVARAMRDGSVLAYVPFLDETDQGLELLARPQSVGSEAVRTLRTNLRFVGGRAPLRTLLVTSPSEAEGKSTIAANLALAAASEGQRVLLVDGDLRRPQVHRMLGIPNGPGTAEVLSRQESLADLLVDPGVSGLRVLTAGRRPPNPAALLGDGGLREVLAAAAADLIIVDGPPVLAVADSLEIARDVDATLMVVAHGRSSRRALAEADVRLARVDGRMAGVVMNLAPPQVGYYYGYRVEPTLEADEDQRARA